MDAVEEVKSRLNIEDVIGEYVQLKRAGRNFKGLSPFGNEKTPSFMVSPEKQIWHDFSSGKGGSMFNFVMEMEGLDFKGALEHLARKAGVDLSQYQRPGAGSNSKLKDRLYDALDQATKFYQVQFSKNKTALDYVLNERKFTKDIALGFRLGYSPNNGTALIDFLKKQKFTDEEIQKSGLSTKRYNGYGDMFRGRLMIPLQDAQGRVIGFTARQLDDEPDAPKYINTPQTLLYDKGRHIYGLHLAKEAIRKNKYAVVTEGNLDVIASHQVGVSQVVATAGTALTEMHLKALARFTGDIRLAFDEDQAGQDATERSIPIASKVGVSLGVITLTGVKDPDELIKKDPKAWEAALNKYQYAVDWLMELYSAKLDIGSAPGKKKFSDVLTGVVRNLSDSVEQDHYIQLIAKKIGVSSEALRAKLSETRQTSRLKQPKVIAQKPSEELTEIIKTQDHLLALALIRPKLRKYLEPVEADMLPGDDAKQLLVFLKANPDFDGKSGKPKGLEQIGDYVKIATLLHETLYQDVEELELSYEAAHLMKRLIEKYVKSKKNIIGASLRQANESESPKLLAEAKKLDQLLKSLRDK